jgi:predicted Zn-dependent protease
MTVPHDVAKQVLSMVPGGVEAAVTVTSDRSGLTRFANSFIHQNVAEEGTTIALTLESGGRVAQATAKVSDPSVLERFVAETVEAVAVAPVNPEWPGFTPPTEVPSTRQSSEGEATPADRAGVVRSFVDAAPDLQAAGYCRTALTDVEYANTLGHTIDGTQSVAILDGIHQTEESAGSGHSAGHSVDAIDGAEVGGLAADRARRGVAATVVPPGEYEVVLGPEAVATIMTFIGFYGFNAKAVVEDQSFVKLGEQQFDPALTVVDDAYDPRALGLPFDLEGTPKQRLTLVKNGISSAIAIDRRQAPKLGAESTGHAAAFFGGYFGALPTSVFVEPGPKSADELISDVEKGIYVATFNYVRILDPRTSVATGLTRNGTFLIEDGEITGAASNLRFTQSFAAAMAPGRILGVGSDARLADGEFGPGVVHAPSMRLAGWRFTGGAEG